MTESAAEPQIATVQLKAGEEDRILAGHQWLFSNELTAAKLDVEPGSLAVAVTSKNQPLGIGFYNPRSLIAWRLLSKRVEQVDEAFFESKLKEALAYRESIYPGAKSFRLCFGESDGLPGLVIDKYEDVFVLQILSAGIDRLSDMICAALRKMFSPKGIYLGDHPARALEGLKPGNRVLFGDIPNRIQIEENGLKFIVPIQEGQKTGYYFDQRENRAAIIPYVKGRDVLDLYCYVGGFGITAARHGAARVLGLDSSALAVELAKESAKLSGVSDCCEFDEGDAEEILDAFAHQKQGEFNPTMILVDPPSFVPSKKHLHKALRAYVKVNSLALKVLKRGGILASSTCSHHVGREDFLKMLQESAAKANRQVRLLELRTQAKDHPILLAMPETEYLHFALLEVI